LSFSPPQIPPPPVDVLVIAGNFSRLPHLPAFPASQHPGPSPAVLWSSSRHSSQLDDIRRAKLHLAAVLHLLHYLATRIVPVRVDAAALLLVLVLVVVIFLLQILQNLASI